MSTARSSATTTCANSASTTARRSRESNVVWQGDRESLGLVGLVDRVEQEGDGYLFQPALLDACLQVVAAADGDFAEREGGLYLPHDIAAVRLFRRPGRRVWVYARLLEKTPKRSTADVDIYCEDGRLAATVRGLRGHRVAGARNESIDDLLFAYEWRPQAAPEPDRPPEPVNWLIFADSGGTGTRLASDLRAGGETLHSGARRLDFREGPRGRIPGQSRPARRYALAHPGHSRRRSSDTLGGCSSVES